MAKRVAAAGARGRKTAKTGGARKKTVARKRATAGGKKISAAAERSPAAAGKKSADRKAAVERTTRETSVFVELDLDGSGASTISTGVPFLDHMLELWSKHGFFDLVVRATGDLAVDQHHTVEDVGLTLGQVFREALGDKQGIRRFGQSSVPLDEALVSVVVDFSGRPFLVYELEPGQERVGDFDTGLVHDFLLSLTNEIRMNLHIDCIRGRNPHHMIEAMFKAMGRAMDQATQHDPRVAGVLSTKGLL
jgi:imidazoleglycerol-phosphate dehydratase